MKRRFFAYALIIISVIIGVFEIIDVNTRVDYCIDNINRIEECVNNKDYKKAERLCEEAQKEFNGRISDFMYIYYRHDVLEDVNSDLVILSQYIKCKDNPDIFATTRNSVRKLQTIKKRENIEYKKDQKEDENYFNKGKEEPLILLMDKITNKENNVEDDNKKEIKLEDDKKIENEITNINNNEENVIEDLNDQKKIIV